MNSVPTEKVIRFEKYELDLPEISTAVTRACTVLQEAEKDNNTSVDFFVRYKGRSFRIVSQIKYTNIKEGLKTITPTALHSWIPKALDKPIEHRERSIYTVDIPTKEYDELIQLFKDNSITFLATSRTGNF